MPALSPSITSTSNPRVVAARKLTQRKYRQAQGLFLVEGLQLLHMALDASATPHEVFYCEEQFAGAEAPALLTRFRHASADLCSVTPRVMESLSEREEPQGIVATFRLLESPLAALTLTGRELVVVLDRLQDPGNLGTLIRTADAVGAQAVILLEPCVDPFDPKTVRGTMGSLFTIPFTRTKNMDEAATKLKAWGYRLVGADGQHGGLPWQSQVLVGPVALVLGNEARGLSAEVRPHLDDYVRLPLRGHAESLNVAVAGGALMYEWLRVNRDSLDVVRGV